MHALREFMILVDKVLFTFLIYQPLSFYVSVCTHYLSFCQSIDDSVVKQNDLNLLHPHIYQLFLYYHNNANGYFDLLKLLLS